MTKNHLCTPLFFFKFWYLVILFAVIHGTSSSFNQNLLCCYSSCFVSELVFEGFCEMPEENEKNYSRNQGSVSTHC